MSVMVDETALCKAYRAIDQLCGPGGSSDDFATIDCQKLLVQIAKRNGLRHPYRGGSETWEEVFLHPSCREIYDAWQRVGDALAQRAAQTNRAMLEAYSHDRLLATLSAFEDVRDWLQGRALLVDVLRRHGVATQGDDHGAACVGEWLPGSEKTFRTVCG